MKYSIFALLCFLAATGTLQAQQSLIITTQTPVNTALLHQWLHSGDPRLIAWAADFARRTHDAKIVAEIPALLEHWAIPPLQGVDESQQLRAITAALDTLIQEDAKAPISTITLISATFPYHAAILIGRLPLAESRTTLQDWTYGATGNWGARTLARVASMMLAKAPDPNFVARVVSESEEDLEISIVSANGVGGGGGSGTCGDSFARTPPAGWPLTYSYDLAENSKDKDASLVVDLDGDRIVSHRFDMDKGWGSCDGVRPLNPATRHLLIAHWLGVTSKDMPWQPEAQFTIVWKDKADYQQQLGMLVESERQKLQSTVFALHKKGLLANGATGVSWRKPAFPKLAMTIKCEIKPCPLVDFQ
jgi:hypothetical protein